MAMTKQNYRNDCIIINTLEELIPQEHLRKQTIERILVNCKEYHNLRFTRLRGLQKMNKMPL